MSHTDHLLFVLIYRRIIIMKTIQLAFFIFRHFHFFIQLSIRIIFTSFFFYSMSLSLFLFLFWHAIRHIGVYQSIFVWILIGCDTPFSCRRQRHCCFLLHPLPSKCQFISSWFLQKCKRSSRSTNRGVNYNLSFARQPWVFLSSKRSS